MLMRCYNPKHTGYKAYGGRGIQVCERWLPIPYGTLTRAEAFHNFMIDMGIKPSQHMSLDRENANKGYEPDNCNWRMPRFQANNKRDSKRVTDPDTGEQIAPAELARRLGITYQSLRAKLMKDGGWPV